MGRQLLISLGREFGSGGHVIAKKMAEKLGIEYYDRNILNTIFGDDQKLIEKMEQYEEKTANPFLSRRVGSYSNSVEENLAMKEFDFIREKAKEGSSFVIVGRCGEMLLKEYPVHISFFVLGDMQDKIHRVQERCQLSERDAIDKIIRSDRIRKKFHNRYSDIKWGDSRGYDLCINVSRLGIDKTTEILLDFVEQRGESLC